jgi:hypothetical protein
MMTRTITALFDDRTDAEAAIARLGSQNAVRSKRILARDTAAAVEDIGIDPRQAKAYRDALQRGGYLVVATVSWGQNTDGIVDAMVASASSPANDVPPVDPVQSFGISPSSLDATRENLGGAGPSGSTESDSEPASRASADALSGGAINPEPVHPKASEEVRSTGILSDIRLSEPHVITSRSGGDGVSDEIRPEQVRVKPEGNVGIGAPLTYEEVEARGLLKERTIEVLEMGEEPVVTKEVFVHEQVIVRKSVAQRTDTIKETLRRTEAVVEELPSGDGAR